MNNYKKHLVGILALIALLLLTLSFTATAQEATPEAAPADVAQPTVEPMPDVTETPTLEPTAVEPTAEPPTVEPTAIEPTADAPTVEPTPDVTEVPTLEATAEATAEPEMTAEPTLEIVSEPPVFNLADGTAFDAVPGVPLTLAFSASDESGVVRVTVGEPAPAGGVSLTITEPVETQPPYHTQVELVYLAPAEFSGTDTVSLVAIDAAGVTAEAVLTINVAPVMPLPTLEPTSAPVKEMLLNYDPAMSEEAIQAMLASMNAVEISRIPAIGAMRVLVPETPMRSMMQGMAASGSVAPSGVTTEPNGYCEVAYTPNDTSFGQQWNLKYGGADNDDGGIAANYAWDLSTTRGSGVTVAVLDTGVDAQHPELATQRVLGWNFWDDSANTDDDDGHGTLVAGIIAAKTNNLAGIAGIAYNAKIMPVKVCGASDLNDDTIPDNYDPAVCTYWYVGAGIVYAVDKGAKVINLSLSCDGIPVGETYSYSYTIKGAIDYALSKNVVVVAAAGDDESPLVAHYPASFDGVISVGSHDRAGDWANSSYLSSVDISAPGVDILSTIPKEFDLEDGNADGYTSVFSGTSLAAPHVSGVVALLMSAKVATTPATVMDALACGADNDFAGYDPDYYGKGLLRADFSMTWNGNSSSCKITQPNDNFEAATVVRTVPYNVIQPVHSVSVTEQQSDPDVCGLNPRPQLELTDPVQTAEQTLWYSYRPATSGNFQFSVLGASYPAVFGVYQGSAGALTPVGCSLEPHKTLPLQATQTYYIMVATNGAAVNDAVLQLQINAALPQNNFDYQENAPNIAYTGTWSRGAVPGASGGYTQQTSDVNATASFSFRGTGFYYVRTIGPDKGAARIWVNGVELDGDPDQAGVQPFSNRAAVTKSNQGAANVTQIITIPGAIPGQWNVVRIMRDANTPGAIDLDRIRTADYDGSTVKLAITAKADDHDARLTYSPYGTGADWNKNVKLNGAYLSTLTEQKDDPLDGHVPSVVFRATGNAITIFRMTGPDSANMEVVIDNGAPVFVSGDGTANVIRPFTIDGLVTMPHVVEIKKILGTGTLQLDAVQASNFINLSSNVKYDDRNMYLAYRGSWTDTGSVKFANALTTRTLQQGSEVSFRFNGTDLCIGYQRKNGAGNLNVYIDDINTPVASISGAGSDEFDTWCLEAKLSTLVTFGTHRALLKVDGAHFTLDYVLPKNTAILTPARGLVQESDISIVYNPAEVWSKVTTAEAGVKSPYLPLGGFMKHTETKGATASFYVNGTGFILYTAVGRAQGCWEVSVDNTVVHTIDLNDGRTRPLGYGVTGLEPGIHRILLTVNGDQCKGILPGTTWMANLDAVRVFP